MSSNKTWGYSTVRPQNKYTSILVQGKTGGDVTHCCYWHSLMVYVCFDSELRALWLPVPSLAKYISMNLVGAFIKLPAFMCDYILSWAKMVFIFFFSFGFILISTCKISWRYLEIFFQNRWLEKLRWLHMFLYWRGYGGYKFELNVIFYDEAERNVSNSPEVCDERLVDMGN